MILVKPDGWGAKSLCFTEAVRSKSGPASSFFNTPRSGEARKFIARELLV